VVPQHIDDVGFSIVPELVQVLSDTICMRRGSLTNTTLFRAINGQQEARLVFVSTAHRASRQGPITIREVLK
jgi:hypothetical protein